MKKLSIIFVLFLTFSINVFSLNRDIFNMDVSAEFGLLNGSVGEYVFDQSCKNTDNMISRLKWDVLLIPYFEGNFSFNLFKYFYFSANGKIGIPIASGHMQDYDWLNSVTSAWADDSPTELTNYSKHNNELDNYYNVSVRLGGNIPIGKKVVLSPFIGYEYDFIGMSAYGGFKKYKSDNFEKITFPNKKAITYRQESNSFITGFNLELNFFKKFPIETYFQVVPTLGELYALDLHFQRTDVGPYGLAFLDFYESIFQLDWKLSAYYEFRNHHRLMLSAYVQYMPLQKGITSQGPITSNGSAPSKFQWSRTAQGGAKRLLFSFSLGYQFKL